MHLASPTLRAKALQFLQRKLLSGAWGPEDVISEQSIAAELGMSRTPVREAIRQLEQEGVLEQLPRFGTRLKPLSRGDLIELYQLREAIEPYAILHAAGNISEDNAQLLKKLCDTWKGISDEVRQAGAEVASPEQMKRLMRVDLAFHQVLLRSSGIRRMMKIVADTRVLTGVFMTERQEHTLPVIDATMADHDAILSAALSGDGVQAQKLIAKHIRVSLVSALAHFDQGLKLRHDRSGQSYPGDSLLDSDIMGSFQS